MNRTEGIKNADPVDRRENGKAKALSRLEGSPSWVERELREGQNE